MQVMRGFDYRRVVYHRIVGTSINPSKKYQTTIIFLRDEQSVAGT